MTKDIWLNLPVKDVQRSKQFFTALGFEFNPHGETVNSLCMLVGEKKVVVMLFDEPTFKSFTGDELTNPDKAIEVLISIDAESRAEVDELANKAVEAGGVCNHTPSEKDGWLYGCVFHDLDGHRWNVLHMDMSKLPQG